MASSERPRPQADGAWDQENGFVFRPSDSRVLEWHKRQGLPRVLLLWGAAGGGKKHLARRWAGKKGLCLACGPDLESTLRAPGFCQAFGQMTGAERRVIAEVLIDRAVQGPLALMDCEVLLANDLSFGRALSQAWLDRRKDHPCLVLGGESVPVPAGLPREFLRIHHIQAVTFQEFRQCVPDMAPAEQLFAYAVFGGQPGFFLNLKPGQSVAESVYGVLLHPERMLPARGLWWERRSDPRIALELLASLRQSAVASADLYLALHASGLAAEACPEAPENEKVDAAVSAARFTLDELARADVILQVANLCRKEAGPVKVECYDAVPGALRFWLAMHEALGREPGSPLELSPDEAAFLCQSLPELAQSFGLPAFRDACFQWLWQSNACGLLPRSFSKFGLWIRAVPGTPVEQCYAPGDRLGFVMESADGSHVLACDCSLNPKGESRAFVERLVSKLSRDVPGYRASDIRYCAFSLHGFDEDARRAAEALAGRLHTCILLADAGIVAAGPAAAASGLQQGQASSYADLALRALFKPEEDVLFRAAASPLLQ